MSALYKGEAESRFLSLSHQISIAFGGEAKKVDSIGGGQNAFVEHSDRRSFSVPLGHLSERESMCLWWGDSISHSIPPGERGQRREERGRRENEADRQEKPSAHKSRLKWQIWIDAGDSLIPRLSLHSFLKI